jgi:hypothetical protein
MMNLRAKTAFRERAVIKSVIRGPKMGFSQTYSYLSLSVIKSGSCQCGSFFNLDPLKEGGRFDEIDEFESKEQKRGGVMTLWMTPSRENRGLMLWKQDLSGGRHDMRLGKQVFLKTTIGSGKSIACRESDEPYAS